MGVTFDVDFLGAGEAEIVVLAMSGATQYRIEAASCKW
jgi:hypothetical protein